MGKTNMSTVTVSAAGDYSTVTVPFTLTQLATSAALPNVLVAARRDANSLTLPPIYSLDGGRHWDTFVTMPPERLAKITVAVVPRSDHPEQPIRFLMTGDTGEFDFSGTIYRTGDFGRIWAAMPFPLLPPCDRHTGFGPLYSSPPDANRLYVEYSCVWVGGWWPRDYEADYTSSDAGVSWQKIKEGEGTAWQVIPSPSLAKRVYTFDLVSSHYTWLQSDTAGLTWIEIPVPLKGLDVLEENPHDPDRLYGISVDPAGYFVGKRGSNNGQDWEQWQAQPCLAPGQWSEPLVLQLLPSTITSGTLVLRCYQEGLYRSRNNGDSWEQLATISGQLLVRDYGNPGRILWARVDGLWASDDDGTTWILLTQDYPPPFRTFLPIVIK
jgi:hypothetical protein